MKRSVNFNGMKRYRNLGANDLIATFRFLGMSDAEIKAKMLEMKSAQQSVQPTGGTVAPADIDQHPEADTAPENNQRPATSG